jgi:predicted kinase
MLVVFGGLPGAGKSTIARLVAQRCKAVLLRIDIIEQAIRSSGVLAGDIGPAGYAAAYGLAESNLALGHTVIADSVNPLPVTREAWRTVAQASSSPILEVEITCADTAMHRQRVENRVGEIPGHQLPDWPEVIGREYAPWPDCDIQIDTAKVSAEQAALQIIEAVTNRRSGIR